MKLDDFDFLLKFSVRDYELDIQGIVNNAVYQNYFEHTRHEHLKSIGINFAELHHQGIDGVVYRIEIDYRGSLKSGNNFVCASKMVKEGNLKIVFLQSIFVDRSDKPIVMAKVTTVLTKNGKPIKPDIYFDL